MNPSIPPSPKREDIDARPRVGSLPPTGRFWRTACGWCLLLCLAGGSLGQEPTPRIGRSPALELDTGPASAVDLLLLQARIQQVVAQATPATLAFEGGTGIIVQPDGLALTCAHVNVEAGRTFTVHLSDGRTFEATSLGNHHGLDAGMIQLQGPGPWPFVPMADQSDRSLLGSWCVALGYAVSFEVGRPPAVRFGRVHYQDAVTIISDCAIMGGDSGGPLLNLDGQLIGICSSCDEDIRDNASVPVNVFREYWNRMLAGEDIDLNEPSEGLGPFRDALTPAFDGISEHVSSSVLRVLVDGQPVALATIVPGDRLAVSKASLLVGDAVVCMGTDGVSTTAKVIHRDPATDLAVLRLESPPAGAPIDWQSHAVEPGTLVATLDELGQVGTLGVVMTEPRIFDTEVPPQGRGYLGVAFDIVENGGAKITEIQPTSAAAQSGLQIGDQVRAIDGVPLDPERTLSQALGGTHPEQVIRMSIERGGLAREVSVTLGQPPALPESIAELLPASVDGEELSDDAHDAWGGGPFSERRFGFTRVIAHDSALAPDAVGGPLINARGQVLGINIARALRVSSYAIPLDDVRRVVEVGLAEAADKPSRP